MALDELVAETKANADWRSRPYFASLADGSFDRDDFVETQLQFFHAVVFFNRPMGVLAARLPRASLRLSLLENVREEHGEGQAGVSHQATFRELLRRLGVDDAQVRERAMGPEVRAFNTLLSGVCTLDDPITAVATMGVIEDLFAGISAFLGTQLVQNGWLSRDEVVHYAVHERLDVQHAREFYDVIRDRWDKGPEHRDAIRTGLELGTYAFLRLYDDLYAARERRAVREGRGAHSRIDNWPV